MSDSNDETEPIEQDPPDGPHEEPVGSPAAEEQTPAEHDVVDEQPRDREDEADPQPARAQPSRRGVIVVGGVLAALVAALIGLVLVDGGGQEPVYTVYGQEVSREELAQRLQGVVEDSTIEAARNIEDAAPEERSTVSRVISDFITEDAMTAAAAEEGIEITEAQVDDQVSEIIDTGFGGEQSQFEAALSQSGQSLEQVRTQFRTALYAEAIVGQAEPVTDAEVQEFYDANFTAPLVSHILVESEAEAAAARERIEDGEDFATVAQDVSIDSSAAQGGRLGPLEQGAFVEPFEEAALALGDGEISQPVETEFGWHLITVEPPPELEDVRDQIRAQIEENRLNANFLELAERLDEEAMITVDPAYGTWQGLNGGGLVPAGLSVEDPAAPVPADALEDEVPPTEPGQ